MDEIVVFEESNVKITNARFMVDGQTYAMHGVTSVRQFEKAPPRILPIMVGLVGAGSMAGSILVGLVILVAAVGIWKIQNPEYSVLLSTASGEARALSSKDKSYIARVVAALNDAIVKRG